LKHSVTSADLINAIRMPDVTECFNGSQWLPGVVRI
jgi:hypothetical protein